MKTTLELIKKCFESNQPINIEYSYINGKESLTLNGVKITEEQTEQEDKFDDTFIKKVVKQYKEQLELLDDCLFEQVTDEIPFNLKEFSNLLDQESFTEEEAELVAGKINLTKTIIHEKIYDKIEDLKELLDKIN